MTDIAHLSARVPTEIRNHFKALAARRGQAVQDLLLQLVEDFIETETQTPPKRAMIVAVLQAHQSEFLAWGIRSLSLVGSFARDAAGMESDIDLVVEFAQGRKPDLFELSELRFRIESWFENRLAVDLALRSALKPDVAANMAADGVEIF